MEIDKQLEDFHPDDRPVLREFYSWLKATGKCEGTWDAYKYSLSKVSGHLPAPLVEASKEDMVSAIAALREEDLENSTVNMIISKLKGFYRWLHDGEGYPATVAWITTDSASAVVLPDELLTRDEIRAMIDACTNSRDRALIVTLYESGLRAHEFLALNVGSVEFEGEMARLILPGSNDQRYKTGQRRVPLADSVPYLKEWINHHPSGDKGDPLWTSLANGYRGSRLSHRGLHSFLGKVASRAGVDKNVYPHLFRHSRATEIAGKGIYSEAEMRILFGWAEGSDMPSKYIHLSGADVDDKFKKEHGFAEEDDEEEEDPLEPVECSDCGRRNPPTNSFCTVCGSELGPAEEEKVEKEEENETSGITAEQMEKALEDPEVKEIVAKKMKEAVSA